MASVFRKQTTRTLPQGAEIVTKNGEPHAKWRGRSGKLRTAKVVTRTDGTQRIATRSETYYAKFRDGQGLVSVVSTGCRDRQAAQAVLNDLVRRAELVRSKVISATEDAIAEHQHRPIAEHVDAYLLHHESRQTSVKHRVNVRGCLNRLMADCEFRRLSDIDAGAVEKWLLAAAQNGMSARTRNRYLSALSAFANWCVLDGRLAGNPVSRVATANERTDPRRQRRSLTESELKRLLDAAQRRPLDDALRVQRGPRKGELVANLSPERRAVLKRLGRERALIYKTMVLTGLRKGELASITIGQCHLDGDAPYIELAAADEKNGEGATVPVRVDLAHELRGWILENNPQSGGSSILSIQGAGDPAGNQRRKLFNVPSGLIRIFDRDLEAAGISKTDDRGRTVDVHALRHTFGTLLSKGGVTPRTAQAAMRHSEIGLTMQVYTDPRLLDVQAALDALPQLSLEGGNRSESARATGTDDASAGATGAATVAPKVAPTSVQPRQSASVADHPSHSAGEGANAGAGDASVTPDNENAPLSTGDNEASEERATGLEPATFSLGS